MREILYRGKDVCGRWFEGGYYENNTGKYIITPAFVGRLVDPETVGQFTGLCDKNGRKIFEGDIVRYCTNTNRAENKQTHEVVYETRGGSGYFGIRISEIETWQFCFEVPAKLMEVIGNIYDNPELLEGGDQSQ